MPNPTFFNLPEDKREKILECAIDEFAEHDYDSSSISKIVARSGIAKGSLYQYFTDKRELYHYLLELAARKKAEMLKTAKPPDSEMNLFETLRYLFQEMSNFELQYPKLAKIGYRAIHGKSPLPDDLVERGVQSSYQYFRTLIEEGKQKGQIRPEVDSEVASFIFTTAIAELGKLIKPRTLNYPNGEDQGNIFPVRADEVAQVYNQIISILQNGLAK